MADTNPSCFMPIQSFHFLTVLIIVVSLWPLPIFLGVCWKNLAERGPGRRRNGLIVAFFPWWRPWYQTNRDPDNSGGNTAVLGWYQPIGKCSIGVLREEDYTHARSGWRLLQKNLWIAPWLIIVGGWVVDEASK